MALPRQLLHRRCFQQVQQCAAFSRPRPSACGCSTRSASGRRTTSSLICLNASGWFTAKSSSCDS
ncbi:hypothetical protein DW908_08580 [Bifidobacterium longum]|nr:hypothetical protein DW908_08580 [Bifidobacterium longum]